MIKSKTEYESKKLAYFLHRLRLGEEYSEGIIKYRRVIGGWIYSEGKDVLVFLPFSYDYSKFAFKPTNLPIELICPFCGTVTKFSLKEDFQGNQYECPKCNQIITYIYKEEKGGVQ